MTVHPLLMNPSTLEQNTEFCSRIVRTEQNDSSTDEADPRADHIPLVRACLLNNPKPQQRSENINSPTGSIGTSRRRINARQGECEDEKRNSAGSYPERAFAEPQPRPEGEATCDLAQRGYRVLVEGVH